MLACRNSKNQTILFLQCKKKIKELYGTGTKRAISFFERTIQSFDIPEFAGVSSLYGNLCLESFFVVAHDAANLSPANISGVSGATHTENFGSSDFDNLLLRRNSLVFDEIGGYESADRNNWRVDLVYFGNNYDTRKFVFRRWKIFLIFEWAFRVVGSLGLLDIGYTVGKGTLTMSSLDSPTIAFFSLLLGLVIALFTAFKYFSNELGTLRREAELNIRSAVDAQDKQRHLLANQVTSVMNELRVDLTRTNEKFQNLALEVVRKADMTSFETRITSILSQQENRFTLAVEKLDNARAASIQHLETKIDRVIELRRSNQDNQRSTGD